MTLPDLSSQFLYGRLAWALVLASVVCAAWPSAWRLPRRALAGIVGASCLLMALPGEASPAWHLGLAFQYPSGLLVGFCLVRLVACWSAGGPGTTVPNPSATSLPLPLAAVLALAGALLYLDAFGLLAQGYYYAGFGTGAALSAVVLAGACAAAIVPGHARPQACAVMCAVLLFSLLRLPSGNLWDALLDPLLWLWSLVALAAAAMRTLWRRIAGGMAIAAATPGGAATTLSPADPGPELPALNAAGAEPFSPIKE